MPMLRPVSTGWSPGSELKKAKRTLEPVPHSLGANLGLDLVELYARRSAFHEALYQLSRWECDAPYDEGSLEVQWYHGDYLNFQPGSVDFSLEDEEGLLRSAPCHPPNCASGSKLYVSAVYARRFAMTASSTLPRVLSSEIGLYAPGIEYSGSRVSSVRQLLPFSISSGVSQVDGCCETYFQIFFQTMVGGPSSPGRCFPFRF
jgi:hypothetical protein